MPAERCLLDTGQQARQRHVNVKKNQLHAHGPHAGPVHQPRRNAAVPPRIFQRGPGRHHDKNIQ